MQNKMIETPGAKFRENVGKSKRHRRGRGGRGGKGNIQVEVCLWLVYIGPPVFVCIQRQCVLFMRLGGGEGGGEPQDQSAAVCVHVGWADERTVGNFTLG